MRTTRLPAGALTPVLGQGIWSIDEQPQNQQSEIPENLLWKCSALM